MDDKIKSVYDTIHELREPQRAPTADSVLGAGVPPTKEWPQKPNTLELDRKQSRLMLAYDAFLIVLPILLLLKVALVIIAWHVDQQHFGTDLDHVSLLTKAVIEINGQMVTIFTIVFVTVVATLVKRHALFKAQQGAYMSELEQFQGSVSLPSTLKMIWSLRAWNRKSIGLVVIWSFQYLGSQANKYEYRLTDSARYKTSTVAVRGPNTPSGFNPNTPPHGSWDINLINSQLVTNLDVYTLSITTGNRLGTDLYGMALLPDLNRLLDEAMYNATSSMEMEQDRNGWYDTSQASLIAVHNAYTGAKGMAFHHPDGEGQYVGEFSYSPNYLNISCSPPVLHDFADFPNGTMITQSVSMNMTTNSTALDSSGHPLRRFELWLRWNNTAGVNSTAASAVSTCNITQIRVDSHVHCLSTGCLQKKMRWYNGTSREASTSYQTPFDSDAFAANFFHNILLAAGRQDQIDRPTSINKALSPFEIVNMTYPSNTSLQQGNYTPDAWIINSSNAANFHQRLKIYFNTYYMLSQDWMIMTPDMDAINAKGTDGIFEGASFKGALYRPHYGIAWEWIAIDITSCLVLLYATVASLLFRKWTIAPDVLGSISSLTRDNPYADLPEHGTTLSGMERARMLKNVRVQLCDVGPAGENSRIGLARVDTGLRQTAALKRSTAYM